jgi:hypothetical protein
MTKRMIRACAAAAVLAAFAGGAGAQEPAGVEQLGWLAGCWTSASAGERRVDEHWMKPLGGSMLGMSRTVVGTRTAEFEFLQIRRNGDAIVYIAKPSGQAEATFTLKTVTAGEVVFENPAHDFPQRIIYRLAAPGALHARIEGTRDGKTRGIDFPMKRGEC